MDLSARGKPVRKFLPKLAFKLSIVSGLFFGYILTTTAVLFISVFYLINRPRTYRSDSTNHLYNLFSSQPPILGIAVASRGTKDARPVILEQFFAKYHSPLAAYGNLLVETADKYQIPWILLAAIAGQESTFCRDGSFPDDSYNCWGWAIHTEYTKKFSSFEEGIEKVSAGLAGYYDRLKIDRESPIEDQIYKIKSNYNSTSKSWANGVLYFVAELADFATR